MVIAHLYSDLLNLYGNDGNIKILEKKLQQIGEEVKVLRPTVKDEMDFSNYDLVYMGSGTEENLEIAIQDLKRYSDDIRQAIAKDKFFLITGNAVDIFGNRLERGKNIEALGIFPYVSKFVPRIQHDVIYKADFLQNPILGYENHNYVLEGNDCPLWEGEGVLHHHFYGTYVEGPILVRNPEFLKYFISQLVKNDETKLQKLDLQLETKAYENFRILLNDLEK